MDTASLPDETLISVGTIAECMLASQRVRHGTKIDGLWIAAVAAANDLPVVTRDDDFRPIEAVGGGAWSGSDTVAAGTGQRLDPYAAALSASATANSSRSGGRS